MRKSRIRRTQKRVPNDVQRSLPLMGQTCGERPLAPGEVRCLPVSEFDDGDRSQLFVGNVPLATYLHEHGLGWVCEFWDAIAALDLMPFITAYSPDGRRAIHPRIMLGLIIYGMLVRQWSLRDLETLAVRDVGAWWFTGGLLPDHSTIGKFIVMHSQVLTEVFFLSVTRGVVKRLALKKGDGAIDGTVIEA